MPLALLLGTFGFIFTILLTPLLRDYCLRNGWVDMPDLGRKNHRKPIPRVGGVVIAFAYLAAFGLTYPLQSGYWTTLQRSASGIEAIFAATIIAFCTGLLDDFVGLKPWQKLAGQLTAAIVAYAGGIHIHISSANTFPIHALEFFLTVLWLLTCCNAFNLIDGLDGLAAGVGLFATMTTLVAAIIHQNTPLLLMTVPLAGALLGFLRYNFNPASIFLGDCGSLMIGFMLGCFGIEWSHKSVTMLGMTAPLMAVAIPLMDTGLSIVRRFISNKPIFGADTGHIHHRLLALGLSHKQVVLLIYAVSGAAATFSLAVGTVQSNYSGVVIFLFCAMSWIGVQHLGYAEFGSMRQLLMKGTFRRIINVHSQLARMETTLQGAQTVEECWDCIRACSVEFGFSAVRAQMLGRTHYHEADSEPGAVQIRLELYNCSYLNFYCGFGDHVEPMVLTDFLKVVTSCLNERLIYFSMDTVVLHPNVKGIHEVTAA